VVQDSLVVIPTYNEAENLTALVGQVLEQGGFDVLIVDDHSPDGTGELAELLIGQFSNRVAVLHHGRLLAVGSPAEVTADATVQQAYLGEEL